MDDIKSTITKLHNTNYSNWSYRIQLLLIKEELWEIVTESRPENINETDWNRKDNKAKALIGLMIDDSQLIHVRKLKTAKEYWETLKKYHEKSTLTSKVSLLKRLCRSKVDEHGNIENHLNSMTEMVDRLSKMGQEIEEKLIVALMLSSLPDSYDTIIMALETRSEDELTVNAVRERLIEESKRREESRSENTNTFQSAMKTERSKFKTKYCKFCNKKGHIMDECWFYKTEKGKQNKNYNKNYRKRQNVSQTAKFVNIPDEEECIEELDKNERHTCFVSSRLNNFEWYIDSASTSHMTSNKKFFKKLNNDVNEAIYLADGSTIQARGKGDGYLNIEQVDGTIKSYLIKNVLYVPEIDGNLLSVKKMTANGFTVIFTSDKCEIIQGNKTIITVNAINSLYKLKPQENNKHEDENNRAMLIQDSLNLWHRRLGHRDVNAIKQITANKLVEDIKINGNKIEECEVCIKGKFTKKSFPKLSQTRTNSILDLIHSDICGPMKTITPGGNKYILTLIDDFSGYTHVYFLKKKEEVFQKYKEFAEAMKTKYNKNIKILRSDNGGEYMSRMLNDYLRKNGTKHEFSAPYSPQQNGVAERKNRSLVETANCMLIDADLDKKFWGEAVNTANYLHNRLPTRRHDKTPYELWYNKKPKLGHVKIFGSDCYSLIPKEKREKFDERAIKLKFVGYSEESKAYRLLDVNSCKISISRNVKIIEKQNMNHEDEKIKRDNSDIEIQICGKNVKETNNKEENNSRTKETISNENISQEYKINEDIHEIVQNKLKIVEEPTTYNEAIKLTDKRKWIDAMNEEINSMKQLETWELVPLPEERRIIDCKWIYKLKFDPVNNKKRYKARLVARGFSQKFGEDYDQVFAPVVKSTTIRTLLTICGIKNLKVKQFDVKTAFLNGSLEETVYMTQPQGFEDRDHPEYVCKLKKSIYGLKQAARAWNEAINNVLTANGFKRAESDCCLYTKDYENDEKLYLLLYVDDIIIACKNEEKIYEIEHMLNEHFEIKIIGDLKYYLGIEIEKTKKDGVYQIHQKGYIEKILNKFNLEDGKTSKIPLDPGYFKTTDLRSFTNNDVYRAAIGSLLYLAVNTRPDIAISVSILSRKISNPTVRDWTEVKRIMKYLKATKNLKLQLGNKEKIGSLNGYSDADWAGDSTDRKSTSGYIIFVHGSPVIWGSKKQTSVSLSSTEAEYIALSEASKEMLWMQGLLKEMDEEIQETNLYEDNQSTLKILSNENFKATKHIETRYHFVKELKASKIINFEYCPSEQMLADILTKPLNSIRIETLRKGIGLQ